jgi:hypothetical protein
MERQGIGMIMKMECCDLSETASIGGTVLYLPKALFRKPSSSSFKM